MEQSNLKSTVMLRNLILTALLMPFLAFGSVNRFDNIDFMVMRSRSANKAAAGQLRLSNSDTINWRNNANGGDLSLGVNGSDQLTFNSSVFVTATAGSFQDSGFNVYDNGDATKKFAIESSGITTGTTRTWTVPDSSDTFVGKATTDIFTNKSISGSTNTFTNIPANTALTSQVPIANGGTGASSKAAGFDALSPMTTGGDLIYGGTSGTGTRLANGSAGQVLTSQGGASAPTWASPGATPYPNELLNAAFDYWQRGEVTAAGAGITVANAATGYGPDRWYVKNSLGTNGVISMFLDAGVTAGSINGCRVQITTAPTAAQTNGTELYQTLTNSQTATRLYNQTASFTVLVKAGNFVNQVGLQFMYKTTEAKVDTTIGSEQLCTVSSGSFTACTITGQALGSSMTTSGVVGIRIRITGVSSGNLYALNNGFTVEQAMLTVSSVAQSFARAHQYTGDELQALKRFYEKSYNIGVNPGTSTQQGAQAALNNNTASSFDLYTSPRYQVEKRAVVSPTIYSTTGASAKCRNITASSDLTATIPNAGATGFVVDCAGVAATQLSQYQWATDAEI